nr:hypothetical protein GCM10020093_087890 [Planobispora longispora]
MGARRPEQPGVDPQRGAAGLPAGRVGQLDDLVLQRDQRPGGAGAVLSAEGERESPSPKEPLIMSLGLLDRRGVEDGCGVGETSARRATRPRGLAAPRPGPPPDHGGRGGAGSVVQVDLLDRLRLAAAPAEDEPDQQDRRQAREGPHAAQPGPLGMPGVRGLPHTANKDRDVEIVEEENVENEL